jgi:hypothetical protein
MMMKISKNKKEKFPYICLFERKLSFFLSCLLYLHKTTNVIQNRAYKRENERMKEKEPYISVTLMKHFNEFPSLSFYFFHKYFTHKYFLSKKK